MHEERKRGEGRPGMSPAPPASRQGTAPSLPVAVTDLKTLGPLWQAGFTAAYHSVPWPAHLVDQVEEPGQTPRTYLAHAIDGAGEAVIGYGCIPGLNWPHGLTVREE